MTDLPIVKTCVGLPATGECLIHRGGEMMCSHVCDEHPTGHEHKCDDPPPPVEPCPTDEVCIGCGKPIAKGSPATLWNEGWAHERCPERPSA